MRFLFIYLFLFNELSPIPAARLSYEDIKEWEQFKDSYQKVYDSKDEETARKQIFVDNLHFIQQHNSKYANEEESYSVKINKFADLTNEEFRRIMNGYKSRTKKLNSIRYKRTESRSLPRSVDWRTEGAVTGVKDQGFCASSWAFSATGSLEGQLFRKSRSLISLSEQNLIDCSTALGNDGCSRGIMDLAFKYVIKNKGIESEESYVYEGKKGNCSVLSKNSLAAVTSFIDIRRGNELDLMEAVAIVGPVSAAIDVSSIGLQFYSYGVFRTTDCSKAEVDHAVLVVGYGTKNGRWLWDGDYWIVKNSLGTSWGMEGYIWIARNFGNMCGIATEASFPLL